MVAWNWEVGCVYYLYSHFMKVVSPWKGERGHRRWLLSLRNIRRAVLHGKNHNRSSPSAIKLTNVPELPINALMHTTLSDDWPATQANITVFEWCCSYWSWVCAILRPCQLVVVYTMSDHFFLILSMYCFNINIILWNLFSGSTSSRKVPIST